MDVLSGLLSLINVGYENRFKQISIKNSKIVFNFLKCLYNYGFIDGYCIDKNNIDRICVFLKYEKSKPLFLKIVRVSVPGRRVFLKCNKLAFFRKKYGFFFVSNSKLGFVSSVSLFNNKNQIPYGGEIVARIIF